MQSFRCGELFRCFLVTTLFTSGWLASWKENVLAIRASWLAACFEMLSDAPSLERLMLNRFQEEVLPINHILVSGFVSSRDAFLKTGKG